MIQEVLVTEIQQAGVDTATPAEVAKALDTTEAGLAQMRYRGVGPRYCKVGAGHRGRVLYRWSDIREFLDVNTVQRTDQPRGVGAV